MESVRAMLTSDSAGYSGTPLSKKLGIRTGSRLFAKNPPENYLELVSPLPAGVSILKRISSKLDIIHFFTKSQTELRENIGDFSKRIKQDGMIWVSWPKKALKVATDMTEDVIREVVLPLGLVDVKVCAVDEIWSGLKIVIRKELRKTDI